MDLYSEAKARQEEWLHEADMARLLKSAQGRSSARRARSHFMMWLGGRLVASGRRLQAQDK